MFKHTLSAASSTYNLATTTACQPMPYLAQGESAPTGDPRTPDQIVSMDAVSAGTSGTAATGALILVDPNDTDTKLRVEPFTITATAVRSNSAGNGGGYVCTVAFTNSGNNKGDLNGLAQPIVVVDTSGVQGARKGEKTRWYLCLGADAGSLAPITVVVSPTRTI